jgi:hypothetical protein
MELATIVVPEDEAKAKLAEYEAAIRQERNAQDEALAAGYRAAARGLPLVRLSDCVQRGGFFDNGLPRIAVARAVQPECSVRWDGDDLIFGDGFSRNYGALVGQNTVRVHIAQPPDRDYRRQWQRGQALVPLIPPRYRPRPRRLRHCHILWEVESWTRIPPRDPALLRHIRGDLWAVLAVWDLTELERAVLASS